MVTKSASGANGAAKPAPSPAFHAASMLSTIFSIALRSLGSILEAPFLAGSADSRKQGIGRRPAVGPGFLLQEDLDFPIRLEMPLKVEHSRPSQRCPLPAAGAIPAL